MYKVICSKNPSEVEEQMNELEKQGYRFVSSHGEMVGNAEEFSAFTTVIMHKENKE